MRPLPTGTLTLLFSDIEGSTVALNRLGDRWAEALSAQRSILRSAFDAVGGVEMGTEGDSFFVVFTSAAAALHAALDGQRRLQAHSWPGEVALRVRMGMHTGEPQRHEDGYIGLDVHRAARIAATSSGGQIVLSDATRGLLGALEESLELRDLGWHRLKDLDEAERLFDVVAPGLLSDFPPLRSLGTRANLPAPATALVGRDTELDTLRSLLQRPSATLVTLTGPGGTGKTRLAVAVAASMENLFRNGIYFVSLHAADRATLMWAAIAEALNAGGDADLLPQDRVRRFLASRSALVVLDNLEQIPDADVVVSQLLADAPEVRVLATSRRPLHLVGEYEQPVPTLDLPDVNAKHQAAAERSGAVQLFVHRATMVRPGFRLSDDNVGDVMELCRRLDGLPLAIELAAARSKLLTPRALLSRIDDRLGTGVTAADRPERQRTLGATIAWSYDLLEPAEQQVFRQLSVFSRSSDLAAIESVVAVDGADPLDSVAHLVDASLIQVADDTDGEPRISMLETIRAFARNLLDSSDEGDDVRLRHARWWADVAARLDAQLRTSGQMSALDQLSAAEDDIRAALDWCLRPVSEVGLERNQYGYRLLMGMTGYWYRFGYVAEGRGWHERAVAVAGDSEAAVSPEIVQALHGMAILALQQNDVQVGTEALERALEMTRTLGDRSLQARELNSLGIARRMTGDFKAAREMLERSVALAREVAEPNRESTALSNLVIVLVDLADFDAALVASRQALAASSSLDDPWAVCLDEVNMSIVMLRAEGPDQAYDHLYSIAERALAIGDIDLSISIVELFAMTLAELGDAERAARLSSAADAHRLTSGLLRTEPDEEILESSLVLARRLLSESDWARAYAEGSGLSLESAVDEARTSRAAHRTGA